MAWHEGLRQASFRGVPFGVLVGEARFGRRLAVHEYPFRDTPWIEDMGRSARDVLVQGFLVEDSIAYGGGPVIFQREMMVRAIEGAGPGILVHPTYGEMEVSLMDCAIVERWDEGRYFELNFRFVESGQRVFPSSGLPAGLEGYLRTLDDEITGGFVTRAVEAASTGIGAALRAVAVAQGWTRQIGGYVRDATSLINMVKSLPGNLGRYFGNQARNAGNTLASLSSDGARARGRTDAASASVMTAAAALSPSKASAEAVASTASALVSAAAEAMPTPADRLRLMSALAGYSAQGIAGNDAVGDAVGTLFSRLAVESVCAAASDYDPESRDDATEALAAALGVLDPAMRDAADAGDDGVYQAFRSLRAALVEQYAQKGQALPPADDLPALAGVHAALPLAQRLYQDASRADGLVKDLKPVHPAFIRMG